MITEDYVSIETAKLLKEKGFDIPIHTFYNPNKNCGVKFDPCLINRNAGTCVSTPTLQMAMKWLREAHNLHITIKPYITNEGFMYAYEIHKFEQYKYMVLLVKAKAGFENNENACEDAIKYCLTNLLK